MRGTWIYSTPILRVYDWLVPKFLNRFIWRCDTGLLVEQYRKHVGKHHIDLGPGTGYFLRRLVDQNQFRFESLLLVDENPSSLKHASRVLDDCNPVSLQIDLTNRESVNQLSPAEADSVSASYLIHCLPRGLRDSELLAEVVSKMLGTKGILFGSVILPDLARKRIRSRVCCWLFNKAGIFGNKADSLPELEGLFRRHFLNCDFQVVECVALFSADNRVKEASDR